MDELSRAFDTFQLKSIQYSSSASRFVVPFDMPGISTPLHILIDSGAGASFIGKNIIRDLALVKKIDPCRPFSVKGVFGQTQIVSEKITIPLRTETWKEAVTFYVSESLPDTALVGLPFIQKNAAFIDFEALTFDQRACSDPQPSDTSVHVDLIDKIHFLRELHATSNEVGICKLEWNEDLAEPPLASKVQNPDAAKILQEYSDVITNEKPPFIPDIGRVTHEIHLKKDVSIPARPPYRMAAAENEALNKEISELLKQGAIVPSSSPFSAPVLFVKKQDGSLRLCVDYRLLNDRTIRNKFPLPVIDDLLDSLGGATIFSKLDLMAGYHQIRIRPGDEYKTAFSTRTGHYQFLVMPFGLTNAPATFQSFMNDILAPYLHKFVVVYLDDILVFSRNKEEHKKHLELVLEVLRENKLIAKESKCEFFTEETTFLGFKLSSKGILPLDDKIKVVRDFPTPVTARAAQSFMGLVNFYRRFIRGFSKIAAPINQFMHDKCPWSPEQDAAFAILKQSLITPPVLVIPDLTQEFVLTTDASHYCVGATLEQRNSAGKLSGVIAYYSKRLQGSQLNYTVQEKEFLGIILALRQYRHLLIGKHFVLRTDHFSLTYLMTQTKTPQGRIARWLDTLAEYDFSIEHISGTSNTAADALSRISLSVVIRPTALNTDTLEQVKNGYARDRYFGEIITALKEGVEENMAPKHIRHYIKHYRLVDHLLYFTATVGSDNISWRLCIPDTKFIRDELCYEAHNTPTSGHFGPYKTYYLLSGKYYWPYMFKHVKKFVGSCDTCQKCKTGSAGTDGLLHPLNIPEQRWSDISLDFVTGLPLSNGYDTILVVIDRLTKRGHFIPTVKTIDAAGTAQLFMKEVVRLHGVPATIVSDRDVRFVSTFWKKLHELLGSKLLMSTANHPQTDGQTERLNRILNTLLRAYSFNEYADWTNYLDVVEFAYNNSYQRSISTTPFFGRPWLPTLSAGLPRYFPIPWL